MSDDQIVLTVREGWAVASNLIDLHLKNIWFLTGYRRRDRENWYLSRRRQIIIVHERRRLLRGLKTTAELLQSEGHIQASKDILAIRNLAAHGDLSNPFMRLEIRGKRREHIVSLG